MIRTRYPPANLIGTVSLVGTVSVARTVCPTGPINLRRSKNTACNAAESGHPEDSPCGQPDRGIRIVSEALANVAKHANAEMVMVSVEAGRGVLSLSVRDDGVGGADPDGSGLNGLRERPKRSAAH